MCKNSDFYRGQICFFLNSLIDKLLPKPSTNYSLVSPCTQRVKLENISIKPFKSHPFLINYHLNYDLGFKNPLLNNKRAYFHHKWFRFGRNKGLEHEFICRKDRSFIGARTINAARGRTCAGRRSKQYGEHGLFKLKEMRERQPRCWGGHKAAPVMGLAGGCLGADCSQQILDDITTSVSSGTCSSQSRQEGFFSTTQFKSRTNPPLLFTFFVVSFF